MLSPPKNWLGSYSYETALSLALKKAQKKPDTILVAFGSLYFVGKIRNLAQKALYSPE